MKYAMRPTGNEENPEEVEVIEIETGERVALGYLAVNFTRGGTVGQSVVCGVQFEGIVAE